MSTAAQLIDWTLLQLSGYTAAQDQSTPLTGAISSSQTTITVGDASILSRGMAEIGTEIIYVDAVDTASGTATVVRGYKSTTATAHTAGERVTVGPLFFRAAVLQALNETIGGVYPLLYGVATTTFLSVNTQTTYQLPVGAEAVLDAKWRPDGGTGEWLSARRWAMDSSANTTDFPSGVSINLWDPIPSGQTVQVTYTKQPVLFAAETDQFSVTGLPSTAEDLIRLGAMWRLVPNLDTPHLAGSSAEADFSANMRPAGGAFNAARAYMQQYQIRLQDEAGRLNSLYPIRIHYTR